MKARLSNRFSSFNKKRQKGVAIITALLIVTLAATISITLSTQLQLDVRRTSNMIATDQAYIYSLLAEKSLQVILQDDDFREGFIELLIKDGIAKQPLLIDNANIAAEVTDLSACININSLVDANGAVDPITENRIAELFTSKGIPSNATEAVSDWIDADLNTKPNGAEDGYYLNLEKPYRTAQSPMASINELRLVKGFDDPKIYKGIIELVNGTFDKDSGRFSGPALCAFKSNNPTPININTASFEVLKSIQPNITKSQIETVLKDRTNGPLTKVPSVFATAANLSTDSSYYLLKSRVVIGNANKVTYSIIYWDGTRISTISRTQRTL